ncbi:hypothetical protein EDD90_3932 [Streptomyces sp. Ag109_O5-1]|nr:hypothetical protein EDD90_3932 [Streptomyces sp. Ag109_O5-1]
MPFDDPPVAHHGDPVGHAGHDPEVVADQQDGHPGLPLGGPQHVQDPGLDGDVERRGRFVGEDQVGVVGHRHGDHRALAHAAGELVRERPCAQGGFGDPDEVEEFDGAPGRLFPGDVLVGADGLGDPVADAVDRGERGERVLEDHRDAAPADPGQLPFGEAEKLGPFQSYGAVRGRVAGQQPEDGQGGRGLPGPRLAHQAEDFTSVEGQIDPAHGRPPVEVDVRTGHVEQLRGAHRAPPPEVGSSASRSPSPTRFTASTNTTSSPAAKKNIHG